MDRQKGFFSIWLIMVLLVAAALAGGVAYNSNKNAQPSLSPLAEPSHLARPSVTAVGTPIVSSAPIASSPPIPSAAESKESININTNPSGTAVNSIASCISIKTSGDYMLSADISAEGIACLQINNVQSVSIDCRGHRIFGNPALESINSSKITLTACLIDSSMIGAPAMNFKNSKDLDISRSTFNRDKIDSFFVNVEDSIGIAFTGNTVYGTYQQSFSSQAEIKNNNFILFPFAEGAVGAAINLIYGSFNKIENNTIDGAAAGKFNTQIGADDGITLMDESHDLISGNKIQNVWDCGIETAGTILNSTFSNNSTKNAGICGIGGWYWSSMKDNIFQNNSTDDAKKAFQFLRNYGLRAARKESGHDVGADTVVYFQNNQFIGNTFLNPRPINDYSSEFYIVPVPTSALSKTSTDKPITDSDIVVGNNTFSGNDFGAGVAPLIWPVTMGIDGGGNHCGKLNPSWPPETSDFTNRYKDDPYPLKCQ